METATASKRDGSKYRRVSVCVTCIDEDPIVVVPKVAVSGHALFENRCDEDVFSIRNLYHNNHVL